MGQIGKKSYSCTNSMAIALPLIVLLNAMQWETSDGEIRHTGIRVDGLNNNINVN